MRRCSASSAMKILLLTPDIPYPSESGAAIRNNGIIRGLSAAGHELTLLSFADKPFDIFANPLCHLCKSVRTVELPEHSKPKRILKLVTSGMADMEFRLSSPEYADALNTILQNETFDVIQFSGLELACYLPLISSRKGDAKVIYDALNAEAALQRVIAQVDQSQVRRWPAAIYSAIQARRLPRFEAGICRQVDAVVAVSYEDRKLLRQHQGAPIYVMPNGVDTSDYHPPADRRREPRQLVFSGKMDYRPNVDAIEWFHRGVLPLVQQRYPDIGLVIVGRNPHARLQALAADTAVEITGWVDTVEPYLQAATIYIVPLRMGSGTRLKILQAMAAGCAVVSTSIGAAGLNPATRSALEIADDADQFAQSIVSLLADEERRRDLGERARRQVRQHYDWSALIPLLLGAYEDIGLG